MIKLIYGRSSYIGTAGIWIKMNEENDNSWEDNKQW